jgi:hypothetical protein
VKPDQSEIALLKTSRRGKYLARQMNEPPISAQSAQKVEIFEQRQCTKPTDSIVSLASDEDPGIPIAEPKDSEHRVYSSQLPRGARRPVKNQPKIAAHN